MLLEEPMRPTITAFGLGLILTERLAGNGLITIASKPEKGSPPSMPFPEPPNHVVMSQPNAQWLQVRHLPSRELFDEVVEAKAGPASGSKAGYVIRRTGRQTSMGMPETERVVCACRIEWKPGTPLTAVSDKSAEFFDMC